MRFLQRALQLDPGFAYGYTLCGHEYVAAEDFDRAKACFESALRLDRRHYNAWCARAGACGTQCRNRSAQAVKSCTT